MMGIPHCPEPVASNEAAGSHAFHLLPPARPLPPACSRSNTVCNTLEDSPRGLSDTPHVKELTNFGAQRLGTAAALELVMGRGEAPVPREGSTTMIKQNQSGSSNINVLDEAQLGQVVGGHRGGHRKYNYGHCYDKKNYDYCNKDYNYSDC